MFLPHPWAPHLPLAQWPPMQHKGSHPAATPATPIHVETTQTSGLSIFPKPPLPTNNYPFFKKALILPLPPNTPHRCIHHCHRTSILQITYPGSRWVQVGHQQATKTTTTTTTQQPLQPQPSTMQSPHTAQTGQHKGGTHSRQGGGHGNHRPSRLQQQSTNTTTIHQHLQSSQQGSYPPTQKQTHHFTQKHQTIRRPQHPPKIQTTLPHKCSPTQVLWPTQNSQNRYSP